MIRKGKYGWYVVSKEGQKISEEYPSKGEAKKREREIQYFSVKHGGKK